MNAAVNVTVVLPCYNAGARVKPVIEALKPYAGRIIIVDDGSTDGCLSGIGKDESIAVIRFEANRGKGHALIAGFREALASRGTSIIVTIDADGQHDPADLPHLVAALEKERAELVIGSRVFDKDSVPWKSRLGNYMTRLFTHVLFGRRLPDTQSGYRAFSRRFLEEVLGSVSGGRYETEMEIVVKAICEGHKTCFVPIQTLYEEGNRSSHFSWRRDSLLVLARLFRSRLRYRR